MDGVRLMDWAEKMWGHLDTDQRARIQGTIARMERDELIAEAFEGREFAQLVLGMAQRGIRVCEGGLGHVIPMCSLN